jgi:hypothetical protein
LPDHHAGQVGHALQLLRNGDRRQLRQVQGAFGDVLGQVAHALQVGVDLQGGGGAAQVHGNRLVQGQNFQALFFNVVFVLVDLRVALDDVAGKVHVALLEGPGRQLNGLLDGARQRQQVPLQVVQVAVEVLGHVRARRSNRIAR